MNYLHSILEPYKFIITQLALWATFFQMLIPMFTSVKSIIQAGSSVEYEADNYIYSLLIGWLLILDTNDVVIYLNISLIVINTIYLLVYIFYASSMDKVTEPMKMALATFSFILSYRSWENPDNLPTRYQIIVGILMLLPVLKPLLNFGAIVEEGRVTDVDINRISYNLFVAFLWVLFGIVRENHITVAVNSLGCLAYATQLAVAIIYEDETVE